jgi:hypothetical protein
MTLVDSVWRKLQLLSGRRGAREELADAPDLRATRFVASTRTPLCLGRRRLRVGVEWGEWRRLGRKCRPVDVNRLTAEVSGLTGAGAANQSARQQIAYLSCVTQGCSMSMRGLEKPAHLILSQQ